MKAEAVEGEEVVGEMADGTPLTLPVIEYDSGSGPSFFIGSTIHGDEVTGQASVWKLRDLIASTGIRGRLTIVPVMNPLGSTVQIGVSQAWAGTNYRPGTDR